ncbi:hypothetical protein B0T25DRAFT_597184 [Lasiosphaeria hispida]|uniref:VWFA domain-containing protein n=1 Tax=Lasiosphaeria hispida TaxID=260671 RepID=A0AAJ0MKI2_9PEZI|nr:hypothetical protein B0T25DRAFT_597184 [Lasiosphaeria hispida]
MSHVIEATLVSRTVKLVTPYAFLSTFDTIFVIDDSGSMAGRSWREVKDALRAITPICTAHDADGVDVYLLNAKNTTSTYSGGTGDWTNIRSADQIMKPHLRAYEDAVAALRVRQAKRVAGPHM